MQTLSLAIDGMSCGHCVKAVQQALAEVPGVAGADVALGSATVELGSATPAQVMDAIRDAGYDVQEGAPAPQTVPLRRGDAAQG